jgi:hypothetical protein
MGGLGIVEFNLVGVFIPISLHFWWKEIRKE